MFPPLKLTTGKHGAHRGRLCRPAGQFLNDVYNNRMIAVKTQRVAKTMTILSIVMVNMAL